MTDNVINRSFLLRILLMFFLMILLLSIVIIRLWNVQVVSGLVFDEKASGLYARSIRQPALRGRIYSSDGCLLAANRPVVNVQFHLSEMPISGKLGLSADLILKTVGRVEKAVGRKSPVTRKSILRHMLHKPGIPMTVLSGLDRAELAKIAEIMPPIRGMELSVDPVRWYPCASLASQLIGYTGMKDPGTAEDRGEYFYYLSDPAGRTGLEKKYDDELKGKPGKKLVKVNHRGFVHEVVGEEKMESASDLITTLDSRLQRKAAQLLEGREGAIVMLDASDGSVLAMESAPGFNLNSFIPRISARHYAMLDKDKRKPFLNKALQDAYMPGSIIKPLVALAILENGGSEDEELECDGATEFGDGSRIRCWAWLSGGHGPLNLTDAIKLSCNDYFIEQGMELGVDKLQAVFASAGIGSRTGIGLPETAGVLPGRDFRKGWNRYETALVSIGQGKIQVSPLQAACYAAAIANGGSLWQPRLVREIRNPETRRRLTPRPVLRGKLRASPQNIAIVREGMFRAVNESGGGARSARLKEISVSGKTGTAEVGSQENRTKNTWFIGFAELPSGRLVAISVLVLRGESGNKTAAPLAGEMFRTAFELNL